VRNFYFKLREEKGGLMVDFQRLMRYNKINTIQY